MTADVLKDSYLMATGYAALMGADAERQHLFARRYDYAVTPAELEQHWKEFDGDHATVASGDHCTDCGVELTTETRYQFVTPSEVTYVCRDHFLERDAKRRGIYRPGRTDGGAVVSDLAQLLDEDHTYDDMNTRCDCGDWYYGSGFSYAAHLINVLATRYKFVPKPA